MLERRPDGRSVPSVGTAGDIALIQRDVRAERRQAEVLEHDASYQQRGELQGEDRQTDQRYEGDQADAGPGQR